MQIAYTYPTGARNGSKVVILGDDAQKHYIRNYLPDLVMAVQSVQVPRAPWSQNFKRFNATVPLTWETHRSFASYDENMSFLNSHVEELYQNPGGLLSVTQVSSGVAFRTALLQRATTVSVTGVSSVVRYLFICTDLSKSAV